MISLYCAKSKVSKGLFFIKEYTPASLTQCLKVKLCKILFMALLNTNKSYLLSLFSATLSKLNFETATLKSKAPQLNIHTLHLQIKNIFRQNRLYALYIQHGKVLQINFYSRYTVRLGEFAFTK